MASNLIGTLLSSQETDARTTRLRTFVPIGCDPALSGPAVFSCLFCFCSCFALDLSRSSADFAISCDFHFQLVSPPSAFSILADRFRVLRFHLAFGPPRNFRSAAVLQNCIGTRFPLQIRRSPAVSKRYPIFRHRETTTGPTPRRRRLNIRSGLLLKITPGDRPLARRVPKGQRRENLVCARARVKLPDPGRAKRVRGLVNAHAPTRFFSPRSAAGGPPSAP